MNITLNMPKTTRREIAKIKLFRNEPIIHVIEDAVHFGEIEEFPWEDVTSKTVTVTPETRAYIRAKSKELDIPQSRFVCYAIHAYFISLQPEFDSLLDELPGILSNLSTAYANLEEVSNFLALHHCDIVWIERAREKIAREAKYLLHWKRQLDSFIE